jgi:hypothetical protein
VKGPIPYTHSEANGPESQAESKLRFSLNCKSLPVQLSRPRVAMEPPQGHLKPAGADTTSCLNCWSGSAKNDAVSEAQSLSPHPHDTPFPVIPEVIFANWREALHRSGLSAAIQGG